MRTYQTLLILLILTVAVGCRKDVPEKSSDCAVPADESLSPVLQYFTSDRFQYKAPHFNPNNPNEFVYTYIDYGSGEFKLMKYDLQTGVKTELADNVKIVSQPKWSRKGWIAFENVHPATGPGYYQLWIVKDNGDSLTQFTTNTANLYPAWDASGDRLYWQHSPVLGIPYYLLKRGLYSSTVDTVMRDGDANNGYSTFNDISIDNKLLSKVGIGNKKHIGFSKLDNISFTSLIDIEQNNLIGIGGLSWSNTSQTAYFTVYHEGLFRLNVNSENHVRLMEFCYNKTYGHISCSSDGTKLIGERVDIYKRDGSNGGNVGETVKNSSIYLIDLATMEETKIDLK